MRKLAPRHLFVCPNTVGYTKVALKPGLNLLSAQFVLVGGETQSMNELASKMTGQTGYDNDSYDPTTELRVWAGDGYLTYGWTGKLLTESPDLADEMGVTDDSFDDKWLDGDYALSELDIPTGSGYWIKAVENGVVTFAGEVPDGDTVTVPVSAGLNLVSYPWPTEADVQKIQISGQTGYDNDSYDPTTEIRIWAGDGYITYGWTGDLLAESPDLADEMGVTDDSLNNKWLDGEYGLVETPIAIGTGFWIKAPNSGTITFSK